MRQVTLFQLNRIIQTTLDQHLDGDYWVIAEVGELRVNQKGHCYMELVEKEGQRLKAKLRATIWAYDFYNLNSLFRQVTGRPLNVGMKILARVAVQFHELYGLSLHVRDLDPNFTLGERARLRQQVIDRLKKEDLFDQNRTLQLPLVPQRVGIISSATAAGYGDFMDHLIGNSHGYKFQFQLFDTTMQGEVAVKSLVRSFQKVSLKFDELDLVVLIRGGGSQVDFDCFDSFEVAAAIANCSLPVITGIGHHRDDTIADMVAHSKMKTPTAVAEFLVNGMNAFDQQLNYLSDQIKTQANRLLVDQQTRLLGLLKSLGHSSQNVISGNKYRVKLLEQRLDSGSRSALRESAKQLERYQEQLMKEPVRLLAKEDKKLAHLETALRLADPVEVLKRGYSITYVGDQLLKQQKQLKKGDILTTHSTARTITSTVTEVKNEQTEDL